MDLPVLPHSEPRSWISRLGLPQAPRIDHHPLAEPTGELHMSVADQHDISSRTGLLVAFPQRRIWQQRFVQEGRWSRVAQKKSVAIDYAECAVGRSRRYCLSAAESTEHE